MHCLLVAELRVLWGFKMFKATHYLVINYTPIPIQLIKETDFAIYYKTEYDVKCEINRNGRRLVKDKNYGYGIFDNHKDAWQHTIALQSKRVERAEQELANQKETLERYKKDWELVK